MDALFGASIIASFLAGMVALFAPCCITVLLPAYIASAFREKRNILKMTFIFFAGLSTILVPIGLGAAGLAQVFQSFHKELWIFGGAFMIFLAVLSVFGKGLSIPLPKRAKEMLKMEAGNHGKSVYALGLLSGAATSCCAPVLAGAMALAVVSGAFWKAIIVVFAYVFGMMFPLFLTAYFYDKYKIEKSKLIQGKTFSVPLGAKTISVHSTNALASAMFFVIGAIMLTLGVSGNAYWSPEHQVAIGKSLNTWSTDLFAFLDTVSDVVWGVLVVGIFLYFVFFLLRFNSRRNKNDKNKENCCH
jgi:cytochrome c biogenesis protein CcdA